MNLPTFLTQEADGFIHVAGHRIGLQHLVHYYNEGYSAEMLACEYPSLSLAEIHKVIAFYLESRAEVDRYILNCREQVEEQRRSSPSVPTLAELRQRLESARGAESL